VIRKVAEQQGFGQDVTVVYIPENAQIVAALVSGAVDAGVLSEPFTSVAISQGEHAVWGPDAPGAGDFVSMSGIVVNKSAIPGHRDPFKRFLMAEIQANHIMKAHPDEAAKYLQELVKIDDPKILSESIVGVQSVLRDDLSMDMSAVQSVIDSAALATPAVAKLKPEQLVDLSLVNEIKDSHFIDTLK
jgi:ABC-type nitrate/sulfonate/bicarbonate transport system substrate-binding protein